MRSLPNLTPSPASRAIAQRRRVQVSPTQSNPVQPMRGRRSAQTMRIGVATACRHNVPPAGRANLNDGSRHPIRHSSFDLRKCPY